MRGAIKLTLIVCNVIALTILTISVWKLRQDFAGHWHYSCREISLQEFKTQPLLSNYPVNTTTVGGKTGARRNCKSAGADSHIYP